MSYIWGVPVYNRYDDLTAEQHLWMFASLRGVPEEEVAAQVQLALDDVNLTHVRDHPAGSYSGGMKRRLSVAIAALGDKSVVFLVSVLQHAAII